MNIVGYWSVSNLILSYRLNLTPAPRDSPFNIPVKRRRVDGDFEGDESNASLTGASYSSSRTRFAYRVSSTARGPVEFFKEQDTHGKWIKIHNSSNDVRLTCDLK